MSSKINIFEDIIINTIKYIFIFMLDVSYLKSSKRRSKQKTYSIRSSNGSLLFYTRNDRCDFLLGFSHWKQSGISCPLYRKISTTQAAKL